MADSALSKPRRGTAPLIAFLIALAFLANFRDNLRNDRIPAGDGRRIFLYLQFVDASGQWYPLWNPYRLGGYPTLADPDRYIWAAPFVDTDSDTANLQFNVLLVALAALSGAAMFLLARALAMSPAAATFCGVTMSTSGIVSMHVSHGRLNALLVSVLIPLGIAAFIGFRRNGASGRLLLVAACAGLMLSTTAHYALVSFFPALFLLGLHGGETQDSVGRRLQRTTRDALVVSLVGIALCAVWIIPLFAYNWRPARELLPQTTLLALLPPPGTVWNLGLPINLDLRSLNRGETFPFVSILLLPALALGIARHTRLRTTAAPTLMLLALPCLGVLLGSVFPFSLVAAAIERVPLLWNIRQPGVFQHVLVMSLVLLTGLALDTVLHRPRVRQAVFAVLALQAILIPLGSLEYGVTNELEVPRAAQVLNRDDDYYRVFDLNDAAARLPGLPTVRTVNGFSMRLSPEHRLQLQSLLGEPVRELRPHWVAMGQPRNWSVRALDQLGVKYLLGHRDDAARIDSEVWSPAAEDPPFVMWRRDDWESPLGLRYEWEIDTDPERAAERVLAADFDPHVRVVLETDPGFELLPFRGQPAGSARVEDYAADRIVVRIAAERRGLLFLPEYYDAGWKAEVDGGYRPVLRANASFRAVPVRRGDQLVTLYYAPAGVYTGALISLATLLLFVGWVVGRRTGSWTTAVAASAMVISGAVYARIAAAGLGSLSAISQTAAELAETWRLAGPHFLFPGAVAAVATVIPGSSTRVIAVALTTAVQGVTALLLYRVFASRVAGAPAERVWLRRSPYVLPAAFVLLGPITLLTLPYRNLYAGYFNANTFENPATILLKPLALLVFLGLIPALCGKRLPGRTVATLAVVHAAALLAKPSFSIYYVPTLCAFAVVAYARGVKIDYRAIVLAGVVPFVTIAGMQFLVTYTGAHITGAQRSITVAPFRVLLNTTPALMILPKLALSIAFPLAVTGLDLRAARRNVELQLAWAGLGTALLYVILLVEDTPEGAQWAAGNFGWSVQVAVFLLFVVATRHLLSGLSNGPATATPLTIAKTRACVALFTLHVAFGTLWYTARLVGVERIWR